MLFDHDDSHVIATTRDGLILHANDYGLAMRLVATDRAMRKRALESVKSEYRTALSVGVTMHGDEYKEIDSVRIRIVRKANLHEVSSVPAGACRATCCTIVDANGSRPLHEDANGLRILSDGAAHAVHKAAENVLSSLAA